MKLKARNERKRLYKEFKEDQRRQKEGEEREKARKNYLPNTLMAPVPESDSSGLTHRGVRFENEENNRRKSRRSSNQSSSESRGDRERERSRRRGEERQSDFYLYRQPQLNKALWETRPRIGNW